MFELSQTFSFDAAHTLKRQVGAEEAAGSSRNGHHGENQNAGFRTFHDQSFGLFCSCMRRIS